MEEPPAPGEPGVLRVPGGVDTGNDHRRCSNPGRWRTPPRGELGWRPSSWEILPPYGVAAEAVQKLVDRDDADEDGADDELADVGALRDEGVEDDGDTDDEEDEPPGPGPERSGEGVSA